jgi:DNA-binding NarL/FixJ family response regulator
MPTAKRLPPPQNLKAYRFTVGDDEWVVFATPTATDDVATQLDLPEAESEVLRYLATGASNAEIAAKRGTSVRTVANQVASLLKRFGVGSRYELIARSRPAAKKTKKAGRASDDG